MGLDVTVGFGMTCGRMYRDVKTSWRNCLRHTSYDDSFQHPQKHADCGPLAKASNEGPSKRSAPDRLMAGSYGHVVDESARAHYLSS